MQGLNDQLGIDKLIGEKGEILIVKYGLEPDGAGGGVNQIVQGQNLAGGDLVFLGAVPRFHGHSPRRRVGSGISGKGWASIDGRLPGAPAPICCMICGK